MGNLKRLFPDTTIGQLDEKRAAIVENLGKEGLKGLKTDDPRTNTIKKVTKQLLENQAAEFKYLSEGLTVGANIAPLETYIYPVLTRALPSLIAYDVVSVQPVTSTLAQARLLKFRHGVARGKVGEGDAALPSFESNVTFSPYYTGPHIEEEPWDRLGTASVLVEDDSGTKVKTLEYPLTGAPTVRFSYTDGTLSGDYEGTLTTVDAYVKVADLTDGGDLNIQRTSNNKITLQNTNGAATADVTITLFSVDYTTSTEGFPISPEFELTLEKYPIEVEVRKLRATATLEALLDLSSHNVAYESDIAEVMSGELRVEMDRTILADLLNGATNAGYTSGWDATIPSDWPRPAADYYRNLILEIAKASAKIFRRTRRGPGNFVICSPDIASILESAQLLAIGDGSIMNIQGYGLIPLGVISRRWKAYVDPLFPRNKILVGYKGDSIYDSGYIFSPYVPAIPVIQPIRDVMVPEFAFHMGVYLAAGYKMIDPGFYHAITVSNLFAA